MGILMGHRMNLALLKTSLFQFDCFVILFNNLFLHITYSYQSLILFGAGAQAGIRQAWYLSFTTCQGLGLCSDAFKVSRRIKMVAYFCAALFFVYTGYYNRCVNEFWLQPTDCSIKLTVATMADGINLREFYL